MSAEIFEVWVGFKFQCHACRAVLEPGDKIARLDDDDSSVLCLDCLAKRENWAKEHTQPVGPTEIKEDEGPMIMQRAYNKATDWMAFD